MATQVKFEGVRSDGVLQFRFENGDGFVVLSLNDGIMTVLPNLNCKIPSFLRNIASCFTDFNFRGLKLIKVTGLNGVTISVTEETADPYEVIQLWVDEFGKGKLEGVSNNENEQVIQVLQTEKLQFKNENARKEWYDLVQSRLDDGVYYAEYWGKYMQHLLSKHEDLTVSQIAAMASEVVNFAGLTGYAYCQAVNILSRVWKYGEELRRWHNKKCGYEGNGVANPTVLRVSVG